MSDGGPPFYVKAGPYVLVSAVAVIAYLAGDALDRQVRTGPVSGLRAFFDEARKTAEDLKRIISEDRKKTAELERELAMARAKRNKTSGDSTSRSAGREKAGQPAGEAKRREVVDFNAEAPAVKLSVRGSPNVRVTFIHRGPKETERGVALFSVHAMDRSEGRFASAVINLDNPVAVNGGKTIELDMETRGVLGVGLGVMELRRGIWLRWDAPFISMSENGEVAEGRAAASFDDMNLWMFTNENRRYIRVDSWSPPEKIHQVRVYLRPRHLAEGRTGGDIWIRSVAIR